MISPIYYIYAYCSCDRNLALRIINGKDRLRPGRNTSSWLGRGFYFFDDSFVALRHAIHLANNGEIKDPAVLGVIIEPGICLNLTQSASITVPTGEFVLLKKFLEGGGASLGKLDKKRGRIPFDSVWCPVHCGEAGHGQAAGKHGQIYLVNPEQIIGYFLPQPAELFNPWLGEEISPRR